MNSIDLIIELLIKNSVDKAWYVQGTAIQHALDFAQQREVEKRNFKSALVQHERVIGFAAYAYFRCGDKVGAVMVSNRFN